MEARDRAQSVGIKVWANIKDWIKACSLTTPDFIAELEAEWFYLDKPDSWYLSLGGRLYNRFKS